MSRVAINLHEVDTGKTGKIVVFKVPRVGETICIIAKPNINSWSGKEFEVLEVQHLISYPILDSITLKIREIK